MTRAVLRLIALLTLVLVAPAQAVVTSSQITAPADPYQGFFDLTAGQGPYGIHVAGSATSSTLDATVDIRCYGPDGVGPVLATLPVANGSERLLGLDRAARPAAAVPAARRPAGRGLPAAGSLGPYTGPRIYPSVLSDARVGALDSPNAGTLYDVFDRVVTPGRTSTLALGCARRLRRVLRAPARSRAPTPAPSGKDVFNCAGWTDLTADGTPQSRSDILVDGRNAFTAGMLQSSGATMTHIPGMPGLSAQRGYDPATGSLKVDETSTVVRCAAELSPFPPPGCRRGGRVRRRSSAPGCATRAPRRRPTTGAW